MPAFSKNKLTIEPVKNGFRMFGYIAGKKIRLRSPHRAELEAMKTKLEAKARIVPADAAKDAWRQQLNQVLGEIDDRLVVARKLIEQEP